MRSPGSDAPRLCASPETTAVASWDRQPLLASSVFPWELQSRSGREGAFLEPTPLSARVISFPWLGWKGPEASCRGRVHTPSNSSLPGMMPLLGAVIASSG